MIVKPSHTSHYLPQEDERIGNEGDTITTPTAPFPSTIIVGIWREIRRAKLGIRHGC